MEHFECHVCRGSVCCKAREIKDASGGSEAWCYACWNEKNNPAFSKKRKLSSAEKQYHQAIELNYLIPNFYGDPIISNMMQEVEDAYAIKMGWKKIE